MKKIKIYSFRNFFESLLFEGVLQFIIVLISIPVLIFYPEKNSLVGIIAGLAFIIQIILIVFFKLFNNASLFIEPDGIKIKRFDGNTETIKWNEVIEVSFDKVLNEKRLLSIKLCLKLINNKTITISLERFIGQYDPLIPCQKIREAIPSIIRIIDVEKPEQQNDASIGKSILRFIKNKNNIPLLIVMGINSVLYANLNSYTRPSMPLFITIILALLWPTFALSVFGMLLAFIIAAFPYKKMSYVKKHEYAYPIGVWIVQILFIIYYCIFSYLRHR